MEKDFNKMLKNNKDMPKIVIVKDEKTIKTYGGNKMLVAPPIFYDDVIKKIPDGQVITTKEIREYLALKNNADFTDPMTAGIFINIVAWASYTRDTNFTPFWRVLKSDGELNNKFPIGVQRELLEKEGHIIISKGTKNIKYYCQDYKEKLANLID